MKALKLITAALTTWILALPALAEVEIQEVTSPGGITAWLVEEPSIPFAALELRFRGGTSLDAPGKRGAIYLMGGLLEEGSGEMGAQEYARSLEGLAASFGYDSSKDTFSISARFLSENRTEVMDLLHQTLHEPRFDQDALDRVRAQVLSGLRSEEKDPNDIAGKAFNAMAFGDHPYGSSGKGTMDSVSALSRQDMFEAHDAVFARDRLYVGAVGDITADELGALLDDLLGDLPATGAAFPGPADVTIDGGISVIDFPTPQSVAIFAQDGIDRDDPEFFEAYIMNQILGGGSFESRLMTEVREKRGLTYGIGTYLVPRDLAAVYMGSVASANGKIAEAVGVIRDEWRKMAEEGVTEKELQDAKTYLTGAYPLRFDGNGQIASILAGMQMQGLPIDYIATRNDKVNAVTLEDVNGFAATFMEPDKLHFTVVGQPEGLDAASN